MTALSSYNTGTVAVAADGTTVTGTGTLWLSAGNAKPGDFFQSGHFGVFVTDLPDDTHLTIPPWPGGTISGAAYNIWKVSQQRIVGAAAAEDVDKIVAALNTSGYFVFVGAGLTVPDPSLGEEGQFAFQPSTGKLWEMSGGVWTYVGLYRGFVFTGAYNGATTYSVGDVMTDAGSSYVWINPTPGSGHAAPNVTYWQLLASKGDPGGTGATGAGYGGTSATSLAIGTGSKPFTTQAGLAYTNGARVRATATAGVTGWLEGVATYSGTTLTIASDKTSGSGTGTAWNFNAAGEPGLDLTSAQSLTTTQQAQARANINIQKKNYAVNGGMQVSQQNGTSAGTTANFYPADQWRIDFSNGGAISAAQVASTTPGGSPNRIRTTVTSADASVANTDYSIISQRIEGNRIADLKFGNASAKSVTVQFGVKAPAGTYCVALRNGTPNRIIVGEYTITGGEANTDVIKSVTFAGDTSGTWATDTGIGMELIFVLMAGSSYFQAPNNWTAAASVFATSNQFNLMGTNGNVFELFDVGLYEGPVAPTFQCPDFASELWTCKRYWEKSYEYGTSPGSGSGAGAFDFRVAGFPAAAAYSGGFSVAYTVAKRTTPTVTTYAYSSGTANKVRDVINNSDVNPNVTASETNFRWWAQLSAGATQMEFLGQYVADARL